MMNTQKTAIGYTASGSPFNLENQSGYRKWRDYKLSQYPVSNTQLRVPILDPFSLSDEERQHLVEQCSRTNFVLYQCKQAGSEKGVVQAIGHQLGLTRLDGNLCADQDRITALQVRTDDCRNRAYIPYSNRPLNWHTDGYYNPGTESIRGMLLHCVVPAWKGGVNQLFDHEMAYLLIREQNPDWIRALMYPRAMTIPGNIENGVQIRDAQSSSVFNINSRTGNLEMRYTARTRSIEWRRDQHTGQAIEFLQALLEQDGPYRFTIHLSPGEGVVSNNVLHNRSGFTDSADLNKKRLYYRARYYDRVVGTDVTNSYC